MAEVEGTYFVEVVLPMHLRGTYTYRVQKEFESYIKVGQRVVVQFGKRKVYSSVIAEIHNRAPSEYQAKYLLDLLDEEPLILPYQIQFWKWISDYYMCTLGEVMNAALPNGLKLSSESKVVMNEEMEELAGLTSDEELIVKSLRIQDELSTAQIASIVQKKSPYKILSSLLEKGIILIHEELSNKVKPKLETYIELDHRYKVEEKMQALFNKLEKKAPKQTAALMKYLEMSKFFQGDPLPVKKKSLEKAAMVSGQTIKSLVEKNIFLSMDAEVGRLKDSSKRAYSPPSLSEAQDRAFKEIEIVHQSLDICLLNGVTSSGKTEVYIKLMEKVVENGGQVLFLVPEIALTTQLIGRLQTYFGEKVGVYHSKFSNAERVEVWRNLLERKLHDHRIIVGARSALFVPLADLQLVIVDEEHDQSYKQFEPAPRYNARDSAIMLANLHDAKVVLGSATPSIESMQNCIEEKYGKVNLLERYGGVQMPEILVADMQRERKRKTLKSHFSSLLLSNMESALEEGKQIILFQNRRGYNPFWQCEEDAWSPQCANCDVSLTYHRHSHRLRCHYCGFTIEPPTVCATCGSKKLKMVGFGTEKIEDEISSIFPKARVQRMDLDTTRKKTSYRDIISAFEDREIDILVGTQMVTKGLDFDNVSVVGVLAADTMLNRPDFRAFERAYQMMTQVSGRSGRRKGGERGKVIVQTNQPEHWVILNVISNDHERLVRQELLERRNYEFPPFVRLIKLCVKHKDRDLLDYGASALADQIRAEFGSRLLGPEYPYVARIRNLYQKEMLLKIERKASISLVKDDLRKLLDRFHFENKDLRSMRIIIDVDPQ